MSGIGSTGRVSYFRDSGSQRWTLSTWFDRLFQMLEFAKG